MAVESGGIDVGELYAWQGESMAFLSDVVPQYADNIRNIKQPLGEAMPSAELYLETQGGREKLNGSDIFAVVGGGDEKKGGARFGQLVRVTRGKDGKDDYFKAFTSVLFAGDEASRALVQKKMEAEAERILKVCGVLRKRVNRHDLQTLAIQHLSILDKGELAKNLLGRSLLLVRQERESGKERLGSAVERATEAIKRRLAMSKAEEPSSAAEEEEKSEAVIAVEEFNRVFKQQRLKASLEDSRVIIKGTDPAIDVILRTKEKDQRSALQAVLDLYQEDENGKVIKQVEFRVGLLVADITISGGEFELGVSVQGNSVISGGEFELGVSVQGNSVISGGEFKGGVGLWDNSARVVLNQDGKPVKVEMAERQSFELSESPVLEPGKAALIKDKEGKFKALAIPGEDDLWDVRVPGQEKQLLSAEELIEKYGLTLSAAELPLPAAEEKTEQAIIELKPKYLGHDNAWEGEVTKDQFTTFVEFRQALRQAVTQVEEQTGRKLGEPGANELLLSLDLEGQKFYDLDLMVEDENTSFSDFVWQKAIESAKNKLIQMQIPDEQEVKAEFKFRYEYMRSLAEKMDWREELETLPSVDEAWKKAQAVLIKAEESQPKPKSPPSQNIW